MRSSTSKRNIYSGTGNELKGDKQNYKELYLESKKNVSIFMKHVDHQITNILNNHEKEKKKLKEEIQNLKAQLRQNDQSFVFSKVPSIRSFSHHKFNSEVRERCHSTVSKDTVEECLSKFPGLELQSRRSEKKFDLQNSGNLTRQQSSKPKSLKENSFIPSNLSIEKQFELMPLKPIQNNLPARNQRFRQKKCVKNTQNGQNIKDFLKGMRGKLQITNGLYIQSKQEENFPVIKIISPEMFSGRSSQV